MEKMEKLTDNINELNRKLYKLIFMLVMDLYNGTGKYEGVEYTKMELFKILKPVEEAFTCLKFMYTHPNIDVLYNNNKIGEIVLANKSLTLKRLKLSGLEEVIFVEKDHYRSQITHHDIPLMGRIRYRFKSLMIQLLEDTEEQKFRLEKALLELT